MKITLSRLNTKDLATLAQRIINLSDSGTYPVIKDHPLVTETKAKYTDYDIVYAKQIYSGKGDNVADADKERDISFSNLKGFLNGYRKLSSVANHQSAEELYQIFKLFAITRGNSDATHVVSNDPGHQLIAQALFVDGHKM